MACTWRGAVAGLKIAGLSLRELPLGAAGASRPRAASKSHHEAKVDSDLALLVHIVMHIDTSSLRGIRDRAILCVGYVGAMRVSETAALKWDEIETTRTGPIVRLGKSKANQEGRGKRDIVVLPKVEGSPLCPVRALQSWRTSAGLPKRGFVWARLHDTKDSEGAVIGQKVATLPDGTGGGLQSQAVTQVIKRVLKEAQQTAPPHSALRDLDLADFAGHSTRRGMATAMAEAGVGVQYIKDALRHATANTTMSYISVRNNEMVAEVARTLKSANEKQQM